MYKGRTLQAEDRGVAAGYFGRGSPVVICGMASQKKAEVGEKRQRAEQEEKATSKPHIIATGFVALWRRA